MEKERSQSLRSERYLRKALTGSFNSQKNPKQFVVTTIFIAANMEKRGPHVENGPQKTAASGKQPLGENGVLDLMESVGISLNPRRICWDLSATHPGNSIAS